MPLSWGVELSLLPDLKTPVRDVARPDPVQLLGSETVAQALSRLRGESIGERIVYFYVTNAEGRLVGVVPTRRLLLSQASTRIADIMVHPVVSVRDSESFGDALQTLTARRLLAVPVVDDAGRLTGILDISMFTQALIDLERRETAEEVFQLAGIRIEEEKSRSTSWVISRRFPWLVCNILSGIAAAVISHRFDFLLTAVVALAFFVPLVLTLAESVAMQSVSISLNHLSVSGPGTRIGILREMRIGLILGFISGAVVMLIDLAWMHVFGVAAVIGGGILVATAAGALFGYFTPRLVRRWNLNPTIASGPVALALTDLAALSGYFGLAALALV